MIFKSRKLPLATLPYDFEPPIGCLEGSRTWFVALEKYNNEKGYYLTEDGLRTSIAFNLTFTEKQIEEGIEAINEYRSQYKEDLDDLATRNNS